MCEFSFQQYTMHLPKSLLNLLAMCYTLLMETKNEVRRKIKLTLNAMSSEERERESLEACRAFLLSDFYKNANCILSYIPLKKELDVSLVNQTALEDKKILCFPKCVTENVNKKEFNSLCFYTMNPSQSLESQIEKNTLCFEPKIEKLNPFVPWGKVCILVPGLAFTKEGCRLGRGKGYYDGFLLKAETWDCNFDACGICFSSQVVESLPVEDHDRRMDAIFASQRSRP